VTAYDILTDDDVQLAVLADIAAIRDNLDRVDGHRNIDDKARLRANGERIAAQVAGDVEKPVELVRPFRRILLDLTKPLKAPEKVNRFIYGDGCLTTLISEPSGAKTWAALTLTRDQLHDGRDVIYLDEENGPDIITERLMALGADPAAVAKHLHYFNFEARRWNDDDIDALDHLIRTVANCTMAVLDSLPDFLTAAGKSEDSSVDVTAFVNTVLRRFRRAGIAQLLLDHLPKPSTDTTRSRNKKQSRYSRGSGAKLAKADATLLLEVAEEFDATHSGRLHLWKTKDRRGRLDLPSLGKPPLELVVKVGDGTVDITEVEPVQRDEWNGPTECMNAVAELLRQLHPTELSGNQLCDKVRATGHSFRDGTIRDAAERLGIAGRIRARQGARNSTLYSHLEDF
jgi:hypothetical protein